MQGDSQGFRPEDKITRGEFGKLIYKLKENDLKEIKISKSFNDVTGMFYQDYTNILLTGGLINGYEDGTFKGQNSITRSEACSMINKVLGRGKDKEKTMKAVRASQDFKSFKDLSPDKWYYFDDIIASVTYTEEF